MRILLNSVEVGRSFFFKFLSLFISYFCLFCVVSWLINIIVDNFRLLWETLLSPLFCGYFGTLGVFVFRGMLGGGCPSSALNDQLYFCFVFYLNG